MSDDVKAAIADALDERWPDWRFRSDARTVDVAEVAFDAAVEAGMAPAAEAVELREDVAALEGRLRRLLADNERYREALELIQNECNHSCNYFYPDTRGSCGPCRAEAALDGDR